MQIFGVHSLCKVFFCQFPAPQIPTPSVALNNLDLHKSARDLDAPFGIQPWDMIWKVFPDINPVALFAFSQVQQSCPTCHPRSVNSCFMCFVYFTSFFYVRRAILVPITPPFLYAEICYFSLFSNHFINSLSP